MKKHIAMAVLFLIFVSGVLLLIMQNSKHTNDIGSGSSSIEHIANGNSQTSQNDISGSDISGIESTDELMPTAKVTDEEREIIQSKCIELSELYHGIYQNAEKTPSQYWGGDDEIAQIGRAHV